MPRARYMEVRGVAARELVRLHDAGFFIDARAIEWANDTLGAKPMGRPRRSDTDRVLALVRERGAAGIRSGDVLAAKVSGLKDIHAVCTALRRMALLGQVHAVKNCGQVTYFADPRHAQAFLRPVRPPRLNSQVLPAVPVFLAPEPARVEPPPPPQPLPPPPPAPAPRKAQPPARHAQVQEPQDQQPKKPPPEVRYAPNCEFVVAKTPVELINRFAPTEPVRGGFYDDWLAKRAGGASS